MTYTPPKALKEWKNDIPEGELYTVSIMDNKTVLATTGRFSHSSGAQFVSCQEFKQGKLQSLVEKTMGKTILVQVLNALP